MGRKTPGWGKRPSCVGRSPGAPLTHHSGLNRPAPLAPRHKAKTSHHRGGLLPGIQNRGSRQHSPPPQLQAGNSSFQTGQLAQAPPASPLSASPEASIPARLSAGRPGDEPLSANRSSLHSPAALRTAHRGPPGALPSRREPGFPCQSRPRGLETPAAG